MTWKRDERSENVRTIGPFTIYSEVHKDDGTAHVVRFPDGRELRVLPDERSGRKRSNLVRQAVSHLASVLEANTSISDETYLFGLLLQSGFSKWEWETGDPSIGEWLANYFDSRLINDGDFYTTDLLKALEADGWTITRRET